MSFYSADYRCPVCEFTWDNIVPTEEKDMQRCPGCEAPAVRVPSVPRFTRKSFVDGTKRFDKLRSQDRIDRALSEAVAKGDAVDMKKLTVEKTKQASKKT